MKASTVGIVLAAALFVSGCYESDTDLTSGHHAQVQAIDALMVFQNEAFYYADGMLCRQASSPALTKKCESPTPVALERTDQGNYIVSVKSGQKYHYALWMRSGKTKMDGLAHCFIWLGDNGNALAENVPLYTRDDLVKVVKAVEFPLLMSDAPCDHLYADESKIKIAGDRRSEPEFK